MAERVCECAECRTASVVYIQYQDLCDAEGCMARRERMHWAAVRRHLTMPVAGLEPSCSECLTT